MTFKAARPLILLSLGLSIWAGCRPGESGKCTGQIDGELYNLLIYNCLEKPMDILVNDRVVGTIPPRNEDAVCSVVDFGEFPQCSNGEIYALGHEIYTDGTAWTDNALSRSIDGCWVKMILVESISDPGGTLPEGDYTYGGEACQLLESFDPYQ